MDLQPNTKRDKLISILKILCSSNNFIVGLLLIFLPVFNPILHMSTLGYGILLCTNLDAWGHLIWSSSSPEAIVAGMIFMFTLYMFFLVSLVNIIEGIIDIIKEILFLINFDQKEQIRFQKEVNVVKTGVEKRGGWTNKQNMQRIILIILFFVLAVYGLISFMFNLLILIIMLFLIPTLILRTCILILQKHKKNEIEAVVFSQKAITDTNNSNSNSNLQ